VKKKKKKAKLETAAAASAPVTAASDEPAAPAVARRPGVWRAISRWEVIPLLGLCVIVFFLWGHLRDRLSAANWGVPFSYDGDSQQIIGWIKAASEGDYIPFRSSFVHRLGAPFIANWNDYPMYEKIITYFLGLVARRYGLFQAANLAMLLVHVTAALSFYVCCRLLRYHRSWSFAGALLFAFTYFNIMRGLGHVLLAFSYTLPFAMLATWLVLGSRRMRLWDRSCWICLGTAIVMGLSNPYNLWMYVQLMGISLLAVLVAHRRRENLIIGLLSIGLAGASFLQINAPTLLYQHVHGRNPSAIQRVYLECELYSLKPMELVIPPLDHHLAVARHLAILYKGLASVKGELFSPYLGMVVAAAGVWMAVEAFCLVLKRKRRLPAYAPQCIWVVAYATLGGLNCLAGLGGLMLFRSSNRYSVFLSVTILLFLVSRLTRLTRSWPWAVRWCVAAAIAVVALYDQLPRPAPHSDTEARAKTVANDRAFVARMERELPPGAMVFQLPVMDFPDAVAKGPTGSYEHLRPYYYSHTLRFSFGSDRGRTREAWQKALEAKQVPDALKELETYGFSAVYINRKSDTNRSDQIVAGLAQFGRTRVIEDDLGEQICVLLQPSPHPELPHTDEAPLIEYGRGFSPYYEVSPTSERRWTLGNASFTFFNPQPYAVSYGVSCTVGTLTNRTVAMEMDGRELWKGTVTPDSPQDVQFLVVAKPRYNTIYIKTDDNGLPEPGLMGPPVAASIAELTILKPGPTP
jgi:hypothetical protein